MTSDMYTWAALVLKISLSISHKNSWATDTSRVSSPAVIYICIMENDISAMLKHHSSGVHKWSMPNLYSQPAQWTAMIPQQYQLGLCTLCISFMDAKQISAAGILTTNGRILAMDTSANCALASIIMLSESIFGIKSVIVSHVVEWCNKSSIPDKWEQGDAMMKGKNLEEYYKMNSYVMLLITLA